MTNRDHVILSINGKRGEIRGADCFLSLAEFLRRRLGFVGTKIVCAEGDCGSCTVLVGRPAGDSFAYRPIDSCIRFMFQLDGVHVVTVEGLSQFGQLTPVQQAMVDCHGSQCGFCTPGFVMAMTGSCDRVEDRPRNESDWRQALTGNLCRCTGYTPILEAGRIAADDRDCNLNDLFPPSELRSQLASLVTDTIDVHNSDANGGRRVFCPSTLHEAIAFLRQTPEAKVVAGATDIGVQVNKQNFEPSCFLDLNRVAELEGIAVEFADGRKTLVAGARSTWTELLRICQVEVPEFASVISIFGAPQIRHVGTIGGNIINASPIADTLPFLLVTGAKLDLVGPVSSRVVDICEFYRGYKQIDLRPDELLGRVRIPLPGSDEILRLFKISRRRDLDISTFTAAIRMQRVGDSIGTASLAYGGVGPTVVRLKETEKFLVGSPFSEATFRAAGDLAVKEIAPIDDVRGSSEYRFQLARNVLLKFFHEQKNAERR